MGLKWFRARLSIKKKQTSKVSTMAGLYRKISYSEYDTLAMRKDAYSFSVVSSSFANNTTLDVDNEKEKYNYAKANPTNRVSPSSTTDSEKQQGFSTSIKDSNLDEQLPVYYEKINKINEDKTDILDTKSRIYQDNEIVI